MEAEVPEVRAQLLALYGEAALASRGVVHVSSAVRAPDGRLHVIKIGPGAPASESDFFVLNLCRARADAIVTSAAILRSEPELVLRPQGRFADALVHYRRELLRKSSAPVCAVLTRSGELSLSHPLWTDETYKVVLTSVEARDRLARALGRRAEVVALPGLDARVAASWLRARGLDLVSMEAGPSTTGPLYEAPSVVDELLLSLYEEPLDPALRGHALSERLLTGKTRVADTLRSEASGAWRFQRWVPTGT